MDYTHLWCHQYEAYLEAGYTPDQAEALADEYIVELAIAKTKIDNKEADSD